MFDAFWDTQTVPAGSGQVEFFTKGTRRGEMGKVHMPYAGVIPFDFYHRTFRVTEMVLEGPSPAGLEVVVRSFGEEVLRASPDRMRPGYYRESPFWSLTCSLAIPYMALLEVLAMTGGGWPGGDVQVKLKGRAIW